MSELIQARLLEADDFPLPFSAYVPVDMGSELDESDGTAHFTAEFGGLRNEDAFVHVYVFPLGTDLQRAAAMAKAYKTGRGIPVSQGLEFIADEFVPSYLAWAVEAYEFRYENDRGWFAGTLGVGRHNDRYFMIIRHYPVEYAEGFQPRANVITRSWQWADGSGLNPTPPEPPPIVEGVD